MQWTYQEKQSPLVDECKPEAAGDGVQKDEIVQDVQIVDLAVPGVDHSRALLD